MSIEEYITDVTKHSYQICGKLFSGDFTQIVKQNHDGSDLSLQHSFYSIDDDGVVKQLGGLTFSENNEGLVTLALNVTDPNSGESKSVLALSEAGLSVTGGIDVVGGSTNFETSSIAVADYDITLGSGATSVTDLEGGGIVLGNSDSGEKTIRYTGLLDSWTSNASFNVETGRSYTVNTDSVILDEEGLTISDIVLSQNGLNIGNEVELNSQSLTIGQTNPVVLNASGLTVGDSLSLSTTAGLQAGAISLDSTGLFVEESIELSVDSGLVLESVSLKSSGLTFNSTTGDVVLNDAGLYLGDDFSFIKEGGLTLGLTEDATTIDDESIKLGVDVLMNHDGLYFSNVDSAIYMGPSNQWKIYFDSTSQNLKFEFFDTNSNSYVVKMELKSE